MPGSSKMPALEAIRTLFRVVNRYVGNLPPMTGVFRTILRPANSFSMLTKKEGRGLVRPQWRSAASPKNAERVSSLLTLVS
jgi:hypothetical protein